MNYLMPIREKCSTTIKPITIPNERKIGFGEYFYSLLGLVKM